MYLGMRIGKWLRRFKDDLRGGLANQIAGIIVALFLLGSVGASAVVMASNVTKFAGAPAVIITLFTVGVVSMAAVGIMLYFIPKRT